MRRYEAGKILLALCLLAALLLSFAACGGNKPIDTDLVTNESESASETETDPPKTEPRTEPGAPLSGQFVPAKVVSTYYMDDGTPEHAVWEYRYGDGEAESYHDGQLYRHYEFDGDGYWTKYVAYEEDGSYTVLEVPDFRTASPIVRWIDLPGNGTTYYPDGKTAPFCSLEYGDDGTARLYRLQGLGSGRAYVELHPDGVSAKSFSFTADGKPYKSFDIEVYEDGSLKKKTSYFPDGSLDEIEEFNENGDIVNFFYYEYGGVFISRIAYEYGDDGKRLRETFYDADDAVTVYMEYAYGTRGNLIRTAAYHGDGRLSTRTEYAYDKNGNKIKEISYDETGTVVFHWECEYDGQNNKTKESLFGPDGKVTWQETGVYEYDGDGNVTRYTAYNADGSIRVRYETEYDDHGNIVKETQYHPDGTPFIVMEFEWVEMTEAQWQSTQFPLYRYFG